MRIMSTRGVSTHASKAYLLSRILQALKYYAAKLKPICYLDICAAGSYIASSSQYVGIYSANLWNLTRLITWPLFHQDIQFDKSYLPHYGTGIPPSYLHTGRVSSDPSSLAATTWFLPDHSSRTFLAERSSTRPSNSPVPRPTSGYKSC